MIKGWYGATLNKFDGMSSMNLVGRQITVFFKLNGSRLARRLLLLPGGYAWVCIESSLAYLLTQPLLAGFGRRGLRADSVSGRHAF